MPKIKTKGMHSSWLRQRELGYRLPLGHNDRLSKELYSSILPCKFWDHSENLRNALHGGVFNLEFSPDSSLLVAACEKKSILMFDPLCRKLIHAVDNAHRDCVNCVRFLDSRVFATCSDDSTVALWDARNLKSQIRTLHGHSNWVKNIEFSPRDGLLVTSGFDGSIYTWDINSYTENGFLYKRVFHTNGLMRTRLNPDASKMVICTTGGYLMIVHDLDLTTLAQDLYGFKPNMYRLMQLSQTTIPVATTFTHLFSKKRKVNRVEIVADFPKGDDAEVVSSLQIHPQGWCALSRNISNDETSEWTCVHDIQDFSDSELDADEFEENSNEGKQKLPHDTDSDTEPESEQRDDADSVSLSFLNPVGVAAEVRRRRTAGSGTDPLDPSDPGRRDSDRLLSRAVSLNTGPGLSAASVELHVSSSDVWEALVAIREARVRRERERVREREEREATANSLTRGLQIRLRDATARMRELQHEAEQMNREVERRGFGRASGEQNPAPRAARFRILVHREEERDGNSTAYRIFNRANGSDISQVPFDISGSSRAPGSGNTLSNPARLIRPNENNNSSAVLVVNHRPRTSSSSAGGASTVTRQVGSTIYRVQAGTMKSDGSTRRNRLIHQNLQRLTHYIEEPNLGKGFIKELCFSADGRLICSPYGYGVRLLAFSPDCAELSSCVPAEPPVKLHELARNICHTDIVVSTKFSPQHCLLVSGCLTGKIVWHQPVV